MGFIVGHLAAHQPQTYQHQYCDGVSIQEKNCVCSSWEDCVRSMSDISQTPKEAEGSAEKIDGDFSH